MASQAIGSLFVALGLDTAAFSAGIRAAQGRIETFANGLSKRLGALGNIPGVGQLQAGLAAIGVSAGAALGAGAAAAAVGLGALSVNAMHAAVEIKNLSALANATPEEFQKLAYAAQSVGIQQEKLSDILKDMNDRVGDFIATGGGPMKDFFEQIAPKVGVTAEQFRNLSGPQALQLYVSSLEKANVNQQDFTFFMEAIASDSTALVPLLRNGGAAAQAYADRLVALGGVMSNETVAKLAAMKSSLSEVGVVVRGMGMELGAAFAPVVQALAQAFTAMLSKGAPLRVMFDGLAVAIGAVAEVMSAVIFIVSSLVSGIGQLVQWIGGAINEATGLGEALSWAFSISPAGLLVWIVDLVKATGSWWSALTAVGQIATEVFARMIQSGIGLWNIMVGVGQGITGAFLGAFAKIATAWDSLINGMASAWNMLAGSTFGSELGLGTMGSSNIGGTIGAAADGMMNSAAASFSAGAGMIKDAFNPLESVANINAQIAASGEAAAAGMTGLGSGIKGAGDSAGGGDKKLTNLQEVMKKLREEADRLKATMGMTELQAEIWEQQREAGVDAASAQGKQIAGLVTQIDLMKQLKDATEEWRDTINSSFADFITKGGSFKDMLSQIIGKLAEMLANSAFDSIFKGIGGDGIIGSILGAFSIGANANGTNNWRGGLSRVNERGGEIMNLPRGTQVIPHDISKRMADRAAGGGMGALAISVSVDQGGGLKAFVRNEAGQIVAQSQPVTVQQAVQATGKTMGRTKQFGGRL